MEERGEATGGPRPHHRIKERRRRPGHEGPAGRRVALEDDTGRRGPRPYGMFFSVAGVAVLLLAWVPTPQAFVARPPLARGCLGTSTAPAECVAPSAALTKGGWSPLRAAAAAQGNNDHHTPEEEEEVEEEEEKIEGKRRWRKPQAPRAEGSAASSSNNYLLPAISRTASPLVKHPGTSTRRRMPPGADEDEALQGRSSSSSSNASRPHTVDLYVPPADLEVMLAWADRLEPPASATVAADRRATSSKLVLLDKEQRLLALAQMWLGMEKLRVELAEARPVGGGRRGGAVGPVTPRQLAARLGLTPDEVEGFYKLGLRARSYILMSMNSLITALARKYGATFGVDQSELVQEGYKGAMQAVERYDRAKAGATGATFRGFAYVYIMSAMITAARNELHLGAAPLEPRDPALMRLASGDASPSPRSKFLLPQGTQASPTGRPHQQFVLAAASSAAGAAAPSNKLLRQEEDDEWVSDEEEEEDEEEAEEAARGRKPAAQPGRRKVRRMRRVVTRLGPGQEAVLEAVGAPGGGGSSSSSSRRAELFGMDPETSRPAYELVDEGKRAQDLRLFLQRAAQELSPQDMQVLSLVYGLDGNVPMKRAEVARKLGLQPAAVNKSERRAMSKLREMLNIAVD